MTAMTMIWWRSILFVACFCRGASSLAHTPPRPAGQLHDRRAFLSRNAKSYAAIAVAGTPAVASAGETEESATTDDGRGGRPFAPPQALLPATRLRIWIEEVYVQSQAIESMEDPEERFRTLQSMDQKLSHPPRLFRGEKMARRTSAPTAQLSAGVSSANKDQYRLNRRGLDVGDSLTAMMNQADVERQWGMLQYAESKREESDEMRAAFNFYTRQLIYGEGYVLTAPREERRRMIRNDALPTPTAVVASDLDRRDLYRNSFLTSADDAIAESAYQCGRGAAKADAADLVELVGRAHGACEDWFALIAPRDVEEAIEEVRRNG